MSKKKFKVDKIESAIEQLDWSIKLFMNNAFTPAITLAGVADEVLGKAVEGIGEESANSYLLSFFSRTFEISEREVSNQYINKVKNNLKHASNRHNNTFEAELDVEAIQYIVRGITNYIKIKGKSKEDYDSFLRSIKISHPNVFDSLFSFNT
jgi:hypothetical protein